MTREQLIKAWKKSIENAGALIEEAELLCQNKRWAMATGDIAATVGT